MLTSAGGLVPVAEAADRPAALLLSGPAGGVGAAATAAVAAGYPDAVTFDMGGTSTDVCLVLDGRPAPAAQRSVGGFPVRLPSLDIHTIGAGGGSIARSDPGGALVVGPTSAGASPVRPATASAAGAPTVTDADLVAGPHRVDGAVPGARPPGRGRGEGRVGGRRGDGPGRDRRRRRSRWCRRSGPCRSARGVDPRGLALVAFGGAGPLHACAVADVLGMRAVVVPPRAGVLSAVGILGAPRQSDLVRSWPVSVTSDGRVGRRWRSSPVGPSAAARRSTSPSTAATQARATS